MPVPSGGLRAAPAAVPMATRWHRWHNSVMMAQIIALLKSYGIGSRRSLHCDTMQEVLRGELERDVERPLSNNGCNGLASARNRRESAFRSWLSCKPATRVGGDDRHRIWWRRWSFQGVRSGQAVLDRGAEPRAPDATVPDCACGHASSGRWLQRSVALFSMSGAAPTSCASPTRFPR